MADNEELGPGENPQKFFGDYDQIYGPQPGTNATNRRFWDDPFVEPKQQHRFGVAFPVYMNMGRANSTSVAREIIKKYDAMLSGIDTENTDSTASKKSALERLRDKANSTPDLKNNPNNGFMVGPKRKFISTEGEGLYLRLSEYIGYAFTPPSLKFTQGMAEGLGGVPQPDDSLNKYDIGDAQITLVTTLRDDLHFSLAFLFAIATFADSGGDIKGGVKLFPKQVYAGDGDDKILVVKEYSARPDALQGDRFGRQGGTGLGVGTTMADMLGHTPARLVGLHIMRDPIIKNVVFSEMSYGGTELIKVQLTLGYGTGDTQATGEDASSAGEMKNFYSYEAAGTRYGRSYFTWKDDTVDGKDQVPDFDERRRKAFTRNPNWWSNDREKAIQKLLPIKPGFPASSQPTMGSARRGPAPAGGENTIETNNKRIEYIRSKIAKTNNPYPQSGGVRNSVNELVTKSIMNEVLGTPGSAAAARLQEEARAQQRQQDSESTRPAGLRTPSLALRQRARESLAENQGRLQAQGGSDQAVLARRISRLSGNQSSAGSNVSEFGKKD